MTIDHSTAIQRISKSKYLDQYAEAEINALSNFPTLNDITPIIVPVYDEPIEFLKRIQLRQTDPHRALWIIVVNTPDSGNSNEILHTQTKKLLAQLHQSGEHFFNSDTLCLLKQPRQQWTLVVNRVDTPIPKKQGVGLARKIGFDIACQLMVEKKIPFTWIATTDADTCLPKAYLDILNAEHGYRQSNRKMTDLPSALVFSFQHTNHEFQSLADSSKAFLTSTIDNPADHVLPDNIPPDHTSSNHDTFDQALTTATAAYENHLHYYVAGLAYAGSPYAYHTLGSILAIDPVAYCLARGFPKRAAGEDFYVLNKLNKIAPVKSLNTDPILIRARASHRVPFGTGPAVAKLILPVDSHYSDNRHSDIRHSEKIETKRFRYSTLQTFHPDTFIWLKDWLYLLKEISTYHSVDREHKTKKALARQKFPVTEIAKQLGFLTILPQLSHQYRSESAFTTALFHWFDAFKTVKFVNLIAHNHLSKVDIDYALQKMQTFLLPHE